VRKAHNLPPSCAVVTKSGNLNFLELSGPVQACNGTAFYPIFKVRKHCVEKYMTQINLWRNKFLSLSQCRFLSSHSHRENNQWKEMKCANLFTQKYERRYISFINKIHRTEKSNINLCCQVCCTVMCTWK